MVTIVKSEWHQVEKRYQLEVDEDLLSEIYPDLDEDQIKEMIQDVDNLDLDDLVQEAGNEGVDLDWEWVDDDWWTDRKGGYEVTYELG